jgi:hypothetical protein
MPRRPPRYRCPTCGRGASQTGSLRVAAIASRPLTPRPRYFRGPCGAARPELSVPHGCAYVGGSHASWHACGCSAGRSACSREYSETLRGMGQISGLTVRATGAWVKSPASHWPLGLNGIGSTISAPVVGTDTPNRHYESVTRSQPPVHNLVDSERGSEHA